MSSPYNRNKNFEDDSEIRFETSEKDTLIKKLHSHIYEMEKNEKNFLKLSSRFKTLQIEYNNLLDEKLRLEYELKQKTEISNRQIYDIRNDIENLQLSLNDKVAQNKKLCNDFAELQDNLDNKNKELDILLNKNANLFEDNNILNKEKNRLELTLQDLREIKQKTLVDLDQLSAENQKLNKIIREDESIIKRLENERTRLLNLNNELKTELKELTNTLRNRDDTIDFQGKQLDEANSNSDKLEKIMRDLELKNSELKNDLNDKLYLIQKETRLKGDREKEVDGLNRTIKDKEREIKKYLEELDFIQNEKNKLYDDNTRMYNEIERLKKHIYIITDQNQNLCDELDKIQDQDEKIKSHLNRKQRISSIIRGNMNNIEESMKQIEELNFNETHSKENLSGLKGSFRAKN